MPVLFMMMSGKHLGVHMPENDTLLLSDFSIMWCCLRNEIQECLTFHVEQAPGFRRETSSLGDAL